MDQLQPTHVAQFVKRFRFRGGSLRRFRLRNHSSARCSGEIVLSALESSTGNRVRLRLVFQGVEEYRFQRRPGPGLVRLKDVQLATFDGVFYLNLDAFAGDGSPAVIDFRASDAFIAGRTLSWEIVPPKSNKLGTIPGAPSRN